MHLLEFAAWLWSIGEEAENYNLYTSRSYNVGDLQYVMKRWNCMANIDFRITNIKSQKRISIHKPLITYY